MHAGRRRARQRTTVALVAALALSAGACGARWNDDEQALVLARYENRSGGGSTATSVVGGPSGAPGAVSGGTTVPGAGTGGGGGTGGAPTGGGAGPVGGGGAPVEGGTGGGAAAGPLPCEAPSDAPGVTDSTITLATISTESGVVPGLGTSARSAVQAYVAYRNANGGVCGRQLVLRTADDGQDNARHRALVQQFDPQVLGIVGGIGGGDAGSAQTVVQLGMPVVSAPLSEQFLNAATVFPLNPPFANLDQPIGKFRYMYEQGARTAAIVYLAVDQTRSEVERQKRQMQAAGIRIVHEDPLPLQTLSYDSAARGVANSGANYVLFVADAGASASMARSLHGIGYEPLFEDYIVAYGSNFDELAGAAAEGAVTWIRIAPSEDPNPTGEQAAFIEWMDRVAPGTVQDQFAGESWASAKVFVDTLEALPGPISREAILAQFAATPTFDAGGLIGQIEFGAKRNVGCQILMRYEGGAWRRIAPAQGFLC